MSAITSIESEPPEADSELDRLAVEINQQIGWLGQALRASARHGLAAGYKLNQAKARAPHGTWGSWIETNIDLSPQWVAKLMRASRDFLALKEADRKSASDLSITACIQLLADPPIASTRLPSRPCCRRNAASVPSSGAALGARAL